MSEAFLKIVNMSISAGWLVLVVLILRLILKKAPEYDYLVTAEAKSIPLIHEMARQNGRPRR